MRNAGAHDGRSGDAVGSFLERLARLVVQRRPRHLVVAEDRAWRPRWRVDLIPSYKSHRTAEPVPPPLAPQIPVIYELLTAIGIDVVGADEHEAEDVIASLCRLALGTVEIVSGDRDLFALVEDPRVRVLYPEKAGLAVIDEGEVTRRYGIPGRRYADFAMLRGDPSDGLPGLRGTGDVGAAAMIRRHGGIDGVLRERRLTDSDRDYLMRARRVVRPVDNLEIVLPRGRRESYPVHEARMNEMVDRHGSREACRRLLAAVSNAPV
jgi:5'-3' exonuclease